MTEKLKFVVIGCGPTALGATYRIRELIESGELMAENVEVTVFEKEGVPGGLSRSITDENGFTWDMGVHIVASTKLENYNRALDEAIGDWNTYRRCVKAYMGHIFGKDHHTPLVPYPVQQAIPLFSESIKALCMEELKEIATQKFTKPPKDFAQWSHRAFGQTLVDIFIRPYNKKVWTVDLEEMNPTWVGERVATVDVENLEKRCKKDQIELNKEDIAWGPNVWFRYPKHTPGIGYVWDQVCKLQPQKWFKFNHQVVNVDPVKKLVISENCKTGLKETTKFDYLISTMPIDILGKISNLAPNINLEYNKVALVGLGLKKPQSPCTKDVSWIYFPSLDIVFYRCTILSNYSDFMTPDSTKYWSVICEIGIKQNDEVTENVLIDQTIKGLISRDVIASADQVVDTFSTILPYGYPIPTLARDTVLTETHNELAKYQIYSRGRFGGWKYEVANQDHSFTQGYELVGKIVLDEKETLYKI